MRAAESGVLVLSRSELCRRMQAETGKPVLILSEKERLPFVKLADADVIRVAAAAAEGGAAENDPFTELCVGAVERYSAVFVLLSEDVRVLDTRYSRAFVDLFCRMRERVAVYAE